jgi:hypothetical protein
MPLTSFWRHGLALTQRKSETSTDGQIARSDTTACLPPQALTEFTLSDKSHEVI